MEQKNDIKPNAPRKVKFTPKAPPRRAPKLEVKTEAVEDTDAVQARDLLQRLNQTSAKTKPKFEKKVAPSQVAFGYGGASASIRSFGFHKGASGSSRDGGIHTPGLREGKEYKEPWDYYCYYPVTLPMRRPYSGNPEFLDEQEFASANTSFDENSVEPAVELGLMEENLEPSMLFLQLPPTVPMIKQRGSTAGNEVDRSSMPAGSVGPVKKTCGLEDLPAGLMGKMLVFKSGAVKLKLGDTLYDVTPGLNCVFAQDVVAVNTEEKQCCVVGDLNKRAVLTPDVDSVLKSLVDL
ncbi:hypothetical protein PTKIN_Ptkin03bG0226400 [Pterospermum kingtungense]